jgi:phosphoglycolate phosphatase
MAERTQAILFDIDGTLIESGGASDRAWHRAFEELHGVDVQISKVTGKGVPDPAVGRQAFEAMIGREPTDEEMAKLMARRLKYLPEEVDNSPGYRVMPHTEELLDRLIDDGYLLGVTTGNVEGAAHIKLSRANLNRFFSFGGYGSDSPDRTELTKRALERGGVVFGKPLDHDRCFSIGDTPRDIEAGHGAGIRVIGVATGKYSADQLKEAGADAAIGSFADGLPLLVA